MERVAASPSEDRLVADIRRRRNDSNPPRRRPCGSRSRATTPGGRPRPRDPKALVVNKTFPQLVDDFPRAVPILAGEVDAIETYLGGLVDQMLKYEQ